jgi:hypothetical protein
MDALNADETALVREHLRECAQCQADAEWQHRLRTAFPQTDTIPDVDQAFSRLRRQIEASQGKRGKPRLSGRLRDLFGSSAPWMRWTLAGQAGIIAVLAILLAPSFSGIPLYRGLGAPGKASGNIVVVFKPETTEQELRQILRESGARLVDGPTANDAYVLNVQGAGQERALDILRARRAVTLAEPLGSGGGR